MKIPMLDLYQEYSSIKREIDTAIKTVITTQSFIGGKFTERFEKEIADYCGVKYAVGVNSGTDALNLSLWALDINPGDEVITSPFTFFATAEVIMLRGAKPVFTDIETSTFNIDPGQIESKITKKTRAILPVHLFGRPADMASIMKIARNHNVSVVEDACQAIGAKLLNRKTGSIGITGCFSFYPSKNIGAYGDGGMVVTNNKIIAEKIRRLKNHGSIIKYQNDEIGVNSRLDGIQAAILSVKLKNLDKWNKKRQLIANYYSKRLSGIKNIQTPSYDPSHVWHQYTIRVKNGKRNQLRKYLSSKGIASMIYYPSPLHLLKALKSLGYKKGAFPNSERASQEVLSLPIYPELSKNKVDYIVNAIKKFLN